MGSLRYLPSATLGILALSSWTAVSAVRASQEAAPTEEMQRIEKSLEVVRTLVTAPDNGIPKALLARAEAIVVVPSLIKGGFVIGAKHGKGVISTRDRNTNTWSDPAFLNMTGGSIGWQIGVESVDLVLLVMNREGVDKLLEDRFTLGGSLSVAGGPVGRSGDAATDAQVTAQILAYSRAKGLFAGATFEGAGLHADGDANRAFYGPRSELRAIIGNEPNTSAPAAAKAWRDGLRQLAAVEVNTPRN